MDVYVFQKSLWKNREWNGSLSITETRQKRCRESENGSRAAKVEWVGGVYLPLVVKYRVSLMAQW